MKCVFCEKKHNTRLNKVPVCLHCFKVIRIFFMNKKAG